MEGIFLKKTEQQTNKYSALKSIAYVCFQYS